MNDIVQVIRNLPPEFKFLMEYGATKMMDFSLNKIAIFYSNLNHKSKNTMNIDKDIIQRCLYNVNLSQEELSHIYAYIINNVESNSSKDTILTYFNILSQLTLSDVEFLERLNAETHIEITKDTWLKNKLSVTILSKFNLIRRDGVRYKDMDGDINGRYIISDIGKDFMKYCTNNNI